MRENRDSAREVHEVVTTSGARLVIRGDAQESADLDQEAWFLGRARQAGSGTGGFVAGSRGHHGRPAGGDGADGDGRLGTERGATGNVSRSALVRSPLMWAGHRPAVLGVGRWVLPSPPDGSFEFPDYAALQAADLANRLAGLHLLAGAGLTPAEIRRAEGLLAEAVAAGGDGPAVPCHGELFPGHIFVTMGEDAAVTVTGLIDFGDACGGRPLDDLGSLCWEWPEVDHAALAADYRPAPFWTDHGRRLALGQLRMLVGYAAHDL